MKEKRINPRKRVNEKIEVVDNNTGTRLGFLVNISATGLMLLSDTALSPNQLFQLSLVPPSPLGGVATVDFGAECLWAQDSDSDGSPCWAGFQIIDISEQGAGLITQLMADWTE